MHFLAPITHVNLIESFLDGRNEKTIQAYRQDLEDFKSFTSTSTLDQAANIILSNGHGHANGLALSYKTHLINRNLQPTTVNRRLAALRSLVKLARTLGIVPWALEIQNMKTQGYRDTKGPGKNGFKNMLNQTRSGKEKKGIRDRAILRLLYDLGLRRGEVVSLDFEDLDLEGNLIGVLGKGRTQKINLTLPAETKKAVEEWIKIRGTEPGALFTNFDPSGRGNRLTGDGLYKIIKKLGSKVGIKARPHGLRHTAITEALDLTSGNIRAVSKFSRHRNIQTLTVYDDNREDLGGNVAQMLAASVGI